MRDKHIAEMADDVRRIRESYFGQADYLFAMKLYEDGYRKTFTSDLASDTQKTFKEGYIKGVDEVAREIFEEIEREIELALDCNYKVKRDAQDDNEGLVLYVDGKIDCLRGLADFIAELKKKYTEGEG